MEHVPSGGGGLSRVRRPSGHHMASPYNPDLDPSLHLPTALPPTLKPEDPERKAVAPGWPLGEQPAPSLHPGSRYHLAAGENSLNSAHKVLSWRTEMRLSSDTRSGIGSPGIWVTEMASVEACRRVSHQGSVPQHFWESPGPLAPLPTAAACKAYLAALPCTQCPWQLLRAGPRAQIMQPAQRPNQARLGGDLHQIGGPSPPLAQYHGDEMLPLLFHLDRTPVFSTEGQTPDQRQRWSRMTQRCRAGERRLQWDKHLGELS